MATDYDAPRRDEVDLGEDSLEELKARRVDAQSAVVDVDETDVAESFELPGADLADEELTVKVIPMQADDVRAGVQFAAAVGARLPRPGVVELVEPGAGGPVIDGGCRSAGGAAHLQISDRRERLAVQRAERPQPDVTPGLRGEGHRLLGGGVREGSAGDGRSPVRPVLADIELVL